MVKLTVNENYFCFNSDQNDADPQADMDEFCSAMNYVQDAWTKEIEELAKTLGITLGATGDVWYLRQRSRWTQEAENEIIESGRNREMAGSGKI